MNINISFGDSEFEVINRIIGKRISGIFAREYCYSVLEKDIFFCEDFYFLIEGAGYFRVSGKDFPLDYFNNELSHFEHEELMIPNISLSDQMGSNEFFMLDGVNIDWGKIVGVAILSREDYFPREEAWRPSCGDFPEIFLTYDAGILISFDNGTRVIVHYSSLNINLVFSADSVTSILGYYPLRWIANKRSPDEV